MEQEILFRGKRIDTGEWVFGDVMNYKYTDSQIAVGLIQYNITPSSLSQATPFTDKNGKRIFDQDTVRMKLLDEVEPEGFFWWNAEVKMVRGCWVLCQIDFDYTNAPWEDYTLLADHHHEIEITGTIQESNA